MHSPSPTDKPDGRSSAPTGLYVVATPIGNLEDITLRAVRILEQVDCIAAEDTRHTARLLRHHRIRTTLVSYHEHNENRRTTELIERIRAGSSVALVSDAGTPSVSDPGYRLVHAAIANGLDVYPIPGVSAAVTALSVSGLPTDAFVFVGFPPKKEGRRHKFLHSLAKQSHTLVFYESPRRMAVFLEEIQRTMGDRPAVLAREMTKLHEEFIRGRISEIKSRLADRKQVKGECTLLVGGATDAMPKPAMDLADAIRRELRRPGARISGFSKTLAKQYQVSKKEVYNMALDLQKTPPDGQASNDES